MEYGKTALLIEVVSHMIMLDTFEGLEMIKKQPHRCDFCHPGRNPLLLGSHKQLPRHQMCAKISFTGKAKASPTFFFLEMFHRHT